MFPIFPNKQKWNYEKRDVIRLVIGVDIGVIQVERKASYGKKVGFPSYLQYL